MIRGFPRRKVFAMQTRAEKIRAFILKEVPKHPKDLVPFTAKNFSVTPTTVHRHINRLVRDDQLVKTGATRSVEYYLKSALEKHLKFKIQPGLEEDQVWTDYLEDAFSHLPKNVQEIGHYSFGEIFNNAIDHSEGSLIYLDIFWDKQFVLIGISDNGVGIFRKIQNTFGFESERECILQLSKGKLTTDPKNHSGEGIFFTSRACENFLILSYGQSYFKNNQENDWLIESKEEKTSKGTNVVLTINLNSKRNLKEIFSRFSHETDDVPEFDTTHIKVDLSKFGDERFVSRSQAKRIVWGLEKFKHVELDFQKVATVGQGFVDEVFRVFQNQHPDTAITYRNANPDVEFMIKRSLPSQQRELSP